MLIDTQIPAIDRLVTLLKRHSTQHFLKQNLDVYT